jgi:magnesium chelatase family protein
MTVIAHEPQGFEGRLVNVEVDIRRGIPGVDLVGLAAGAVREARERVRAAIRNSGFCFPLDRVLVNLAPADLPKEGSAYDLPMALAVLGAAGSVPDPGLPFLALGELRLDGSVRPVRGVLPAVAAALAAGVDRFVVPIGNLAEARTIGVGQAYPIGRLQEATLLLDMLRKGLAPMASNEPPRRAAESEVGDLSAIRGQALLRRALEVAAAGGHNLVLFGPPGSGKTMAVQRLPGILPSLSDEEAVEIAALRSLAGLFDPEEGLDARPPFRAPHHSASLEGLVGGGRRLKPGEISLAHRGILFLDEAPEFRRNVLQALREPLEEGRVSLVRAGAIARYPADFQLCLAANPCPCGNLGRRGRACLCSTQELQRYRKKIGGPLLDRIDIRVPMEPTSARELMGPRGESSEVVRGRVVAAIRLQEERFRGGGPRRNSRIGPDRVEAFCELSGGAGRVFERAVEKLSLSSRACHSILKIARTIADLEGGGAIEEDHVLEAVQHRRFGDDDAVWPESH